jgi:hypothetical protein
LFEAFVINGDGGFKTGDAGVPLATGSDEMQRGARWRSCPVRLWKKGCEEEKEAMAGAQSPFEAGASTRAAGEGGPAWVCSVEEGKEGGWYNALTGCGGRSAAGRGHGGGGAQSARDGGGS